MPIYAFLHHPPGFSQRSGMFPMVEAVGAVPVYYDAAWEKLQQRSWTLGHGLRQFGIWHYGTTWNALVPLVDEWKMLKAIEPAPNNILHFIWGEFAGPSMEARFRKKAKALIGTFHCSARRQDSVILPKARIHAYDWIVLMSETQRPFFIERGYPADRLRVILHGMDSTFWNPGTTTRLSDDSDPLQAIMVGSTERDHDFASALMRKIPRGVMNLSVLTMELNRHYYNGLPGVTMLDGLTDEELRDEYRKADLLFLPLLDCTANNVVLEAMACGTPVMTNRVGGIPEHVSEECGFIMEEKNVDDWISLLRELAGDRSRLEAPAQACRAWAEKFDWKEIASQYRDLYAEALCS